MSFDVYLSDNKGNTIQLDNSHTEGGNYVLGGTLDAELNITYNYSRFYYQVLDRKRGLRCLNGRKAYRCIKKLERAVDALGTRAADDYWLDTPGNAGRALQTLLHWAKAHPKAIFGVS